MQRHSPILSRDTHSPLASPAGRCPPATPAACAPAAASPAMQSCLSLLPAPCRSDRSGFSKKCSSSSNIAVAPRLMHTYAHLLPCSCRFSVRSMRLAARLPESSICSAACLSLRAHHKSADHRLTMEDDVCMQAACLCTMCTCWPCRGANDCQSHLHATLLPLSQTYGHATVCNTVAEGAAGCAAARVAEVLSRMCCEPSCQVTAVGLAVA